MVRNIENSLSAKIFISITTILSLISLLIFGMLRIIMPTIYQRQLDAQLIRNIGETVVQLENAPQSEWNVLLYQFSSTNNAAIEIHYEIPATPDGSTGRMISVTPSGEEGLELWDQYYLGETSNFYTTFNQNGGLYIVNVMSIAITNSVQQLEGIFFQVFPYVFIAILLVAILTAFLYTRFLAKPIVEIAHTSRKMANLDLSWHCETNRNDEIGLLANNLNQMANQLTTTLQELTTANEQLQNDIEKEREHERRRRDFFTAASHELKTPVTILKGELDGMILNVGKFKDRDKYLQEAYKTSERVEMLVREMMTLAKLDTICLNLEKINLLHMINEIAEYYEPIAKEKQITISIEKDPSCAVFVKADGVQLQTTVSNVVSNAVKHSPQGEKVEIKLMKENENVVLTVENKGAQIEEGEILKVWEPFYRTDKSRSRDTGGSGLGLYIVKTILDLHGFSYNLANSENGVKFTMWLAVDRKCNGGNEDEFIKKSN